MIKGGLVGSTFSGLSTALSALYAQRQGLDLTGQNVANANTQGYTRQRLNLESRGAPTVPAFFSTYDGPGNGVDVADIGRLRNQFLENRAHNEHGTSAQLTVRKNTLAQIEDVFNEPSADGLQAQLSDFWNAWHDLSNRPGDNAARSQLLQRANTLADSVNQAGKALEDQWQGNRTQLTTLVAEVNTTAKSIAELNTAIKRNTQAGLPANEMADQRDLLIMKLADKVGASVKTGQDGALDVYVGGSALVRGQSVQELEVRGATEFSQAKLTAIPRETVQVSWKADGYPAALNSGEGGGYLEALNTLVPKGYDDGDQFAANLLTAVNTAHAAGYGTDGVTGRDLFAWRPEGGITVAITSPEQVGAAAVAGSTLDGGQASKLAALANDPAGPDAKLRAVITQLGVDAQTANRRSTIQNSITTQVDASREAESGVDLDEEMTNMLAFQRAYEGAARVLTSIDQALDTLINRTGRVGL